MGSEVWERSGNVRSGSQRSAQMGRENSHLWGRALRPVSSSRRHSRCQRLTQPGPRGSGGRLTSPALLFSFSRWNKPVPTPEDGQTRNMPGRPGAGPLLRYTCVSAQRWLHFDWGAAAWGGRALGCCCVCVLWVQALVSCINTFSFLCSSNIVGTAMSAS